jgi:hypothetical protein
MLDEGFVLDGSMNLTVSGLTVNDEHVTYRCDPEIVPQRRALARGGVLVGAAGQGDRIAGAAKLARRRTDAQDIGN